ncbi:MAG TPA: hypothetical protein VGM56_16745 [Byssovorax sp.]
MSNLALLYDDGARRVADVHQGVGRLLLASPPRASCSSRSSSP